MLSLSYFPGILSAKLVLYEACILLYKNQDLKNFKLFLYEILYSLIAYMVHFSGLCCSKPVIALCARRSQMVVVTFFISIATTDLTLLTYRTFLWWFFCSIFPPSRVITFLAVMPTVSPWKQVTYLVHHVPDALPLWIRSVSVCRKHWFGWQPINKTHIWFEASMVMISY